MMHYRLLCHPPRIGIRQHATDTAALPVLSGETEAGESGPTRSPGAAENRHIYPGLGDAGAHVSQIMDMDAGWSSFMLSYWARERGEATIVNGQVSLLDGELTGNHAGRVLRHSA